MSPSRAIVTVPITKQRQAVEEMVDISGPFMISTLQVATHGLIGMQVITMILPLISTVLEETGTVQPIIYLLIPVSPGNNLSIIMVIKVNVDAVVNAVEILVVAVTLAVVAVGDFGAVQVIAVATNVAGIIVVVLAVVDGIIVGVHLF